MVIPDGYTVSTIHYHWCQLKDVHCKTAVKVEPSALTSYRFASACVNKTIATTSSGSYSRLWAQFIFERESSFYVIQIYLPAMLVVFISWVSFWINPESAPSRTVIGTFTILSETHLLMSTNRRLPPVSYVKAVDVYLGFCYLNVVLALIEYATVTYSKKKYEDRKKKNKSKNMFALTPQLQAPDLLQDARIDGCTCEQNVSIFVVAKHSPKCANFCTHSKVDLIARIAFPASFLTFNLIYWTVLISLSERKVYENNSKMLSKCLSDDKAFRPQILCEAPLKRRSLSPAFQSSLLLHNSFNIWVKDSCKRLCNNYVKKKLFSNFKNAGKFLSTSE
uniref:Neur_chan_memb domain-containing protein n=1 Tax=Elaeophora elaphi TaxID=1147741 RepID=A0A0R3RMI9_9BILA